MTGGFDDILTRLEEFVRSMSRVGPDDIAIMKGHIRASRDDLNVSKILYNRHNYSASVYHLQQSVEKATKAFCIATGLITASEAKRIGHESLHGHFLYADKLSSFIPQLGRIDPRLNADISKIGEVESKRLEMARLDRNGIEGLLASLDAVDKSMEDFLSQLGLWAQSRVMRGAKEKSTSMRPSSKDTTRSIARRIELSRSIPFLFVASAITFPHEEFTRYPDREIKPWDYGKSMGIVACTPELIRRMDKTLRALESMTE